VKHSIETVLRVRLRHQPGHLARLTAAIAEQDGLIGEVTTLAVGETYSTREVTIETDDDEHTARVIAAARALPEVTVEAVTDRVFECHAGGKLRQASVTPLTNVQELRRIYTPGVARVSMAIYRDPVRAWELTGIGNSVGIFTNGTRVLGLGDIGVVASMPVMEGKAVLYEQLVGINATPILVDTSDVRRFIATVLEIAPTFAGIHLEDIRSPDCFEIERALQERLCKPVFHDDQFGTATVALAAVINAAKLTGIDLRRARVGQVGLGAAGSAIASLLVRYGVGHLLVCDRSEAAKARVTGSGVRGVSLETLLRESEIVVAATGVPHLIPPSAIHAGQVVLALSNPVPEISATDAIAAGAAFAADGRSINNALAFPGLFKGALLARAREIRPEMMIAAAETIAAAAAVGDLVPSPLLRSLHRDVAGAVRACANRLGLEGTLKLSANETSRG
jgi:malate dehydrogenase (oxaloacetate-decarboxylating)